MRAADMSLGQIIQLLRRQEGLTQAQLAEAIDVSERSIQEYEAGRIDPTPRLRDIEAVLGRPPGFISDQVNPYPKVAKMAEDMEKIKEKLEEAVALLRLLVEQSAERKR